MNRRTLLRAFAAVVAARPFSRLFVQAPTELDEPQIAMLGAIAEVVLPSELQADQRDLVVQRFVDWVRGYRAGADMGHGYGFASLRRPSGPAPAARYPEQFAALNAAAGARGAASFVALPLLERRALVEAALESPRPVVRLPSRPDGESLIADFMGLYFASPEAWDLGYGRRIGRDRCRTLEGSEQRPAAIDRAGARDTRDVATKGNRP